MGLLDFIEARVAQVIESSVNRSSDRAVEKGLKPKVNEDAGASSLPMAECEDGRRSDARTDNYKRPKRLDSKLEAVCTARTSSANSCKGSLFTVVLDSYGENKIGIIKVIREEAGLGLAEAKKLVESAPCVVTEYRIWREADFMAAALIAAGGIAHVGQAPANSTDSVSTSIREGGLFTVVLDSYGENKIGIIKVIREEAGLGLAEAKELVESAPCVVAEKRSSREADALADAIISAGGKSHVDL